MVDLKESHLNSTDGNAVSQLLPNSKLRKHASHGILPYHRHPSDDVTPDYAGAFQPCKQQRRDSSCSSTTFHTREGKAQNPTKLSFPLQRRAEFDDIADWDVIILCSEQPTRNTNLLLPSYSAPLPTTARNSDSFCDHSTTEATAWPNSRSSPAYTQSAFELGSRSSQTCATTRPLNSNESINVNNNASRTCLHGTPAGSIGPFRSALSISEAASQPNVTTTDHFSTTLPPRALRQTASSVSQQQRAAPARQIRARKSVLAEHSPVLAQLLDEFYNPEVKTVIINDNADVFQAVNFYLHFGFVDYLRAFNFEQLLQLWQRALKYKIADLACQCVRRLIKIIDADSAMYCIDTIEDIIVDYWPRMQQQDSSGTNSDEIRLILALESFITIRVLSDDELDVEQVILRTPHMGARVMQRVLDLARCAIPKNRWQSAMIEEEQKRLISDGFDVAKIKNGNQNKNELFSESSEQEITTIAADVSGSLCNLQ